MAACPQCAGPLGEDGSCPRCARSAGRAGDATRGRIERLADGWALPVRDEPHTDRVVKEIHVDELAVDLATPTPEPGMPAPVPAPPKLPTTPRPSRPSRPPPTDRAETARAPDLGAVLGALEEESAGDADIPTERQPALESIDLDTPPPSPPQRKATPSRPPPLPPQSPRKATPSGPPPPLPLPPTPTPPPRKATPSRPPPPPPPRRGPDEADPTVFDPRSPVPELDGGAHRGPGAPQTEAVTPLALRSPGRLGDVRYAFAVIRGLVAGRREVAQLKERLALERAGRLRRLVDAAKAAVADPSVSGEAVESSRERLLWLEEQRALDSAAAEAAEEEARRADEEKASEHRAGDARVAELGKQIAAIDARLKPLVREAAERKKALETYRAQMHALAKRIDGIERRLAAARDGAERAAVEAELAAARAERQLGAGEEPKLSAAHAELLPRIETLEQQRAGLERQVRETLDAVKAADTRLTAAARDARERRDRAEVARKGNETARDAELEQLAQVIDQERPPQLARRLRPVDEHAAAIADIQRRVHAIEVAAAGVDRWALMRGLGLVMVVVLLLAVGLGLALR